MSYLNKLIKKIKEFSVLLVVQPVSHDTVTSRNIFLAFLMYSFTYFSPT